jgi:hypothetical protein
VVGLSLSRGGELILAYILVKRQINMALQLALQKISNSQNCQLEPDRNHQIPNVQGDVYGCGILMNPDNKLTTFYTLNGILLGKLFSAKKHLPYFWWI